MRHLCAPAGHPVPAHSSVPLHPPAMMVTKDRFALYSLTGRSYGFVVSRMVRLLLGAISGPIRLDMHMKLC
jgi:hypothetical protein